MACIRLKNWQMEKRLPRSAIMVRKPAVRMDSLMKSIRIFLQESDSSLPHLAAAYANGSGDAFSGTNSTGQALAMELYNYCVSQPDIPDVAMSFSDADVTAYIDGNSTADKRDHI